MEFLVKGLNDDASEYIRMCPFLRNINKPTSFSSSLLNFSSPVRRSKGPIFEDGPNFGSGFKLFHGKDGVVPLSDKVESRDDHSEPEPDPEPSPPPQFNPLAGKFATISLSGFGPGGPFGFESFNEKRKKQDKQSRSNKKKEPSSKKGNTSKHEAFGNEWLATGNCPIAKSCRAISGILPLVASKIPSSVAGMKLKCPPTVVAVRAALVRTALVRNLRPQPLPAKMLAIALLGMAVNVPLSVWKEHTKKFSFSWFVAVHAAVPFIAMLRKSVVMPKTAMALTIGASILGQIIGSRAERYRLKALANRNKVAVETSTASASAASAYTSHCAAEGTRPDPRAIQSAASPTKMCC